MSDNPAVRPGCPEKVHVLMRWSPVSTGSKIRMRWRNIDHKAETKFRFE
ncbi:MAG: hypothetical protein WCL44_13605 [bacterium]